MTKTHKTARFPAALPAPRDEISVLDTGLLRQAIEASRQSPRKRVILPLHKQGSAPLQRMLNALQPGTYVRPHRHDKARAESLVVLAGGLMFIAFEPDGSIRSTQILRAGSPAFGIDFDGDLWHSMVVLEPDTVLYEAKPGPYDAAGDKQFADWAPEEFTPEAEAYLASLQALSTSAG